MNSLNTGDSDGAVVVAVLAETVFYGPCLPFGLCGVVDASERAITGDMQQSCEPERSLGVSH